METKTPMEEAKELLKFGLGLGNAFGKSLSDGKFSLSDVTNFLNPLKDAFPAFTGISSVKDFIIGLDEQQHKELMDYAKAEFDLDNDNLEAKVEGGIDLALHIYRYGMLFVKKPSFVEVVDVPVAEEVEENL